MLEKCIAAGMNQLQFVAHSCLMVFHFKGSGEKLSFSGENSHSTPASSIPSTFSSLEFAALVLLEGFGSVNNLGLLVSS